MSRMPQGEVQLVPLHGEDAAQAMGHGGQFGGEVGGICGGAHVADEVATGNDIELVLTEDLKFVEKFAAGRHIADYNDKQLTEYRREDIGFVFQFHHLLPEFTALENVMIPAFIAGRSKKDAEEAAKALLTDLGLAERFTHKPSELSGGEQQRVAIARALINKPAVLFADEPSGNLDSRTKEELHKLFFTLRDKYGQTIVIVTHDPDLAGMCDRSLFMRDGQFE